MPDQAYCYLKDTTQALPLMVLHPSRSEAMARAYLAGHYTLKEVGQHFNVSYATVSRAVKEIECKM